MRGARCALTCDPARKATRQRRAFPQAALNGRRRSQRGEGRAAVAEARFWFCRAG